MAILANGGWTVHQATTTPQAIELVKRYSIRVVIANGRWRELLSLADDLAEMPSIIVTMPFADEALWAEVLNLGGYDVLEQPFDGYEVMRITQAALRRSMAAERIRAAV